MTIDKNYVVDYQRVLVVMAMLSAVEDSDYTKNHSLRVGKLVKNISEKLMLSIDEKNLIVRTAYFHDVGKIKLPRSILFKMGKLDNEEYEQMRKHPIYGYEISRSFGLNREADIILKHHERLDGSGYPNGVGGKEFDKLSQILAVADVYDAITADRPYRKGATPKEALLYLYSVSDRHFSLKIVKTLHEVLEENKKIRKTLNI